MIKRALGAILALTGALGVLICALGIFSLWRLADDATKAADSALGFALQMLNNIENSLNVASATMENTAIASEGLYTSTLSLQETLQSAQSVLGTTASLVEDSLPQSIEAALVALESMQETAYGMDQTLRGISRLGLANYAPAVPLDQAIADVRESLEPVPADLRRMGVSLRQVNADLNRVQESVEQMGGHVSGLSGHVGGAAATLGDHIRSLNQLQQQMETLRQNAGRPIRLLAWGGTLLLAWIGLSQLAVIQWGISLWQKR